MDTIKFKCKSKEKHSSEEAKIVIVKPKKSIPGISEIRTVKVEMIGEDWEFRGECGDGHVHFYKYNEKL